MNKRAQMLLALTVCITVPAIADEAIPPAEQVLRLEVLGEANQVIRVQPREAVAEPLKKVAENEAQGAEKQEDVTKKPDKPSEDELRKKMRELEQQLQEARNEFQQKANQQREKVKQDAIKKLQDIKLRKNPTREQCEAYVAELRKACEGRRSFSSNDPATKKLKELPPEHYDLLITEMTNRTSLRYFANYAMREIEPEKLRERFVASIDDNPNNIGIIVMQGWVEDVRPQIIEHINAADSSITLAWFQAAVELDEPALYPKLHELATQSRYASQFINLLEMLPDYDLAHTIDVCWRRAKEGKLSVSYTTFAAKAAQHGNVDALGALVDQLRSSTNYMSHSSTYNLRRTNVLRHIDYRGSNSDIQKWYRANKDKLVFDHLRKRFVLPEEF